MSYSLRNPHSVLAVLETRPKDVLEVIVPQKAMTQGWERVAQLARQHGIPVGSTQKPNRNQKPQGSRDLIESQRMSVAEARVQERKSISPEELFRNAMQRENGKGLWLALDSLQDPHNVGAIFRAASFFNVQGILMTEERSAPLTPSVYDVASGGVEYVPFAIQTNLQRGFEVAKEAGLWILGTSEHAQDSIESISRDRPWLLVLGNEEKGMRRLTSEACDLLCKIPGRGKVTSLNVSVAAGILIQRLSHS